MNITEYLTMYEKVAKIEELAGELMNSIENKNNLYFNQTEFEISGELYDILQSTYTINILLSTKNNNI